MNNMKVGALLAVSLMLFCAVACISVETVEGDGESVTISSADFNSSTGIIVLSGTSSESSVTVYVTSTSYTSQYARYCTDGGSYSGTFYLGNLSTGIYTITVFVSETVKAERTFTVSDGDILPTGISLNKSAVTIYAGSNEQLIATLSPDNSTGTVQWSSNASLLASVDSNGLLTAKAVGTARITATVNKDTVNEHSAFCDVTVAYSNMAIDHSSLSVEKDKSSTLIVTLPSGYASSQVIWSSSDPSTVSVSGTGTSASVSGIAVGTATITATVGSLYKATCTVIVTEPQTVLHTYSFFIQMQVDSDKVTNSSFSANDLKTGFTITGEGYNAGEALQDACDRNSIPCSLYSGGLLKSWIDILFGLGDVNEGNGIWTYWAQYHDGSYNNMSLGWYTDGGSFSIIRLTSTPSGDIITYVTGVVLNKTLMSLTAGGSETLTATVSPSDATIKEVTWSSSNQSVATVDGNGKVTAVSDGTSVITVTTDNGNFKATCTVTVGNTTVAVTGVSLSSSSVTLTSDTEVLTATVSPDNAVNKNVTWSSSNTSVVIVSNGVLTPISAGTAIITVTTEDGRFTATCSVTVKAVKVIDISVMPVTDADGNTSAKITDDQIASAVKNIKESADGDSKPIVTADISAGGSSGSSILTVSSSALNDLADVSADLKIVTDLGTVLLDSDTLASLSAKGDGDVAIAVADVDIGTLTDKQKEQVGDGLVISFNVTVDNSAVHELGGTVSVTVPYELEDGQDASQVTVWYMDDEGNMNSVSCSYDSVNKTVRFTTDHFSYFVIEYGISVDDRGSVSGMDYMLIIAIIAIALILAGVGAYMFRRSKGAE